MHPISELLCETYAELYKNGQVQFPLHDSQRALIDSVVKTVNASYFGYEPYSSPEDKAVAYLCILIKDHPVTDGNKRLSLLWFRVYCIVSKLKADPSPYTFDQIAVSIEKEKDLPLDKLIPLVKKLLFGKSEQTHN